jgi:deoxyhypusine synthase
LPLLYYYVIDMENYKKNPIIPFKVNPDDSVVDVLEKMGDCSFQGRNLSSALDIWDKMLSDTCTIFFGLSGAMTAAGMRLLVTYLIDNRFIDCLVSTGANIFHDIHEAKGFHHWKCHPDSDDLKLKDLHLDRVYDTLLSEDEFRVTDNWLEKLAYNFNPNQPLTSREFLYMLGEKMSHEGIEDCIVAAAYRQKVPIYIPALADSSIGIALAAKKYEPNDYFKFDIIGDVYESSYIVENSPKSGVIYIGGGAPKNFIQQSKVVYSAGHDVENDGHTYAIQITTDAPHWGGLSGCTFSEAKSWGKIARQANTVTVFSDATISLPILVNALAARRKNKKREFIPQFKMGIRIKLET